MAALALHGGDHIVASDSGPDSYAQYVTYANGEPLNVVLINTGYYSGCGEQSDTTFTLTGLEDGTELRALRMTAFSSEVDASLTAGDAARAATIGGN